MTRNHQKEMEGMVVKKQEDPLKAEGARHSS